MRDDPAMSMRIAILAACALILLGCDNSLPERQRIVVFAGDLCVVNQPMMRVETSYIEDSVAGTLQYSEDLSVTFYVGSHPDLRGAVEELVSTTSNPAISSVSYLRFKEGNFAADVEVKGGPEHESLIFRSDNKLSDNASFAALLGKLRRCRLSEN